MMPALLFLLILALGTAVYVVSALVLGWSRRSDCVRPARDFAPPVSIIKPLSGLDEELEENLESFYRLDYPSYEIVFSFARREDPAHRHGFYAIRTIREPRRRFRRAATWRTT